MGQQMNTDELPTVINMLELAVVGQVNDTYERYVFHGRMQHDGESRDEFITASRELIKTCDICEHMQDNFLKAQVIFGLQDATTREKLLQEQTLSLNKCLDMCRAAESATEQAKEMAAGAKAEVNYINFSNKNSSWSPGYQSKSGPTGRRQPTAGNPNYFGQWKQCSICGRHHPMTPGTCLAVGCHGNRCQGQNHFTAKCPQNQPALNRVEDKGDASDDTWEAGQNPYTATYIRMIDTVDTKAHMSNAQ